MVVLHDTDNRPDNLRGVITDKVLTNLQKRNAHRAHKAILALGKRWAFSPLRKAKQ